MAGAESLAPFPHDGTRLVPLDAGIRSVRSQARASGIPRSGVEGRLNKPFRFLVYDRDVPWKGIDA